MAYRKNAVTLLLTNWSYHSLALSYRYNGLLSDHHLIVVCANAGFLIRPNRIKFLLDNFCMHFQVVDLSQTSDWKFDET